MWKKKHLNNGCERAEADGDYTFLAKGMAMQGIAKMEGVVRIDGYFQGAIHTNDMLIIGEHAVIRGSITAEEIICSGKIQANLTAQKRIQLLNPAVVIGDVTTPAFSVEEGVYFRGKCDMGVSGKVACLAKESADPSTRQNLIAHGELVPT